MGVLAFVLFLLLVVCPIAAIIVALQTRGRIEDLTSKLRRAEARIDQLSLGITSDAAVDGSPKAEPKPESPRSDSQEQTSSSDNADEKAVRKTAVPAVAKVDGNDDIRAQDRQPQSEKSTDSETSFEERLGTKWAVYIGGVALAVGAVLLVRYSIEIGLIGPRTRIALGALLSALLLAAGEWCRRREIDLGVEEKFAAHIPSVLTAAGTIAAFATAYAAYALYHFLSDAAAFVILGAIGIVTLIGSAIHGPALAALGLIGSYVTPLLVSSQTPNPWALVVFLLNVSAAALVLARLRRWPWLVAANIAGVVGWGSILAIENFARLKILWADASFAHVILQTLLVALLLVVHPYYWQPGRKIIDGPLDKVAVSALTALCALFVVCLAAVSFQYGYWLAAALVMVAILVASGLLSSAAAGGTALAGVVVLSAMFLWPNLPLVTTSEFPAILLGRLPQNVTQFLQFAGLTSLGLTAAVAYRLYVRPVRWEAPLLIYACAMTVPILLAFALSYVRVTQFGYSLPFGCVGAILAASFAWLADVFDRRNAANDDDSTTNHLIASCAALACVCALSMALVTCLGRGYLTVAFAITALASVAIAFRRDMPMLRYVLVPLGLIVLARIVWNPAISGSSAGSWPIFNWLLVGYGIPALSFAGAAWLLLRNGIQDATLHFAQALAILFITLLVFFQIRHIIHDGDILAKTTTHVEMGLFMITSLGFSFALKRMLSRLDMPVFDWARDAFFVLSGLIGVFGLAMSQNPYFSGDPVIGAPIFNTLILSYLVPGVFSLVIARQLRHESAYAHYALFASCLGLVLLFLFVTLEVRHLFHGRDISMSVRTTDVEMWAYNISWLVLAVLFLGYGLLRQSLAARVASAVLLTGTVLKIGLFDLSELAGFWRAFSFICLGAVLIGIGLVYQKLIFNKPSDTAGPE